METLIIVDVQKDFCEGGSLAVTGGNAVVPVINKLMKDKNFDLIIATKDWHPAKHISFASRHAGKKPFETVNVGFETQMLWPDHCVIGTSGAEFHSGLDLSKVNYIVHKGFNPEREAYSAFKENDGEIISYLGTLTSGSDVTIVGIAFDVCVLHTAIDARRWSKTVTVLKNACASVSQSGEAEALKEMKASHIKVV